MYERVIMLFLLMSFFPCLPCRHEMVMNTVWVWHPLEFWCSKDKPRSGSSSGMFNLLKYLLNAFVEIKKNYLVFIIPSCICLCVCAGCTLHVVVFCGFFLNGCRPKITCLDFKKSKLTLVVVEDDEQVKYTHSFCQSVTTNISMCVHEVQNIGYLKTLNWYL